MHWRRILWGFHSLEDNFGEKPPKTALCTCFTPRISVYTYHISSCSTILCKLVAGEKVISFWISDFLPVKNPEIVSPPSPQFRFHSRPADPPIRKWMECHWVMTQKCWQMIKYFLQKKWLHKSWNHTFLVVEQWNKHPPIRPPLTRLNYLKHEPVNSKDSQQFNQFNNQLETRKLLIFPNQFHFHRAWSFLDLATWIYGEEMSKDLLTDRSTLIFCKSLW